MSNDKGGSVSNTQIKIDPMYDWAVDLFPFCRSLSGQGVRDTFNYLKNLLPGLDVHSASTGFRAFDWTVPDEWNIRAAYIEDSSGKRIVDFRDNNLHVLNYSEPVDKWVDLTELDRHLYSLPEMPDAIPYVTSYYKKRWGFCLTHEQRLSLQNGQYRVVIDSTLEPGNIHYGELLIPGTEDREVLISTYVCHPSMANNELSGLVVTTALARWLLSLRQRRYSYRFVFVPETIGSIVYLSIHSDEMKAKTVAGFVVTCVGDERTFSYLPSRYGNTLSDRAALHVLNNFVDNFDCYSFLDRGSDERQYCSPGIELPVASIMRSKYGVYPEYHTSKDDLTLISQVGLTDAFEVYQKTLLAIEHNRVWRNVVPCEPQMGKRGLYPSIGTRTHEAGVGGTSYPARKIMDVLAYADGTNDLIALAEHSNIPVWDLVEIIEILKKAELVVEVKR